MKKVSRIEYCASFEPLQSGMGQDGESKILFPTNEVLTERQVRKPQYLCGFRDFPNRINLPLYTKFTPIGAKNGAETKKSHNLRNEWAVP